MSQDWSTYCSNSTSYEYSKIPGTDQSVLFYSISIVIPVIIVSIQYTQTCVIYFCFINYTDEMFIQQTVADTVQLCGVCVKH